MHSCLRGSAYPKPRPTRTPASPCIFSSTCAFMLTSTVKVGCTARKVFYYKEKKLVPLGCIGSQIIASKAALRKHFAAQMAGVE